MEAMLRVVFVEILLKITMNYFFFPGFIVMHLLLLY